MYFDGQLLYPPYCQLRWDELADSLDEVRATDVAKARHIIGYGRPVWKSIMGVYRDAGDMIERVMSKLCGSGANHGQALLCMLGQRLGLTIALEHREAAQYVEQAVASHMRIGVTATEDRRWSFTTCLSEPFLSCAAAAALHRGEYSFSGALEVLREKVGRGRPNDERAERVSREGAGSLDVGEADDEDLDFSRSNPFRLYRLFRSA